MKCVKKTNVFKVSLSNFAAYLFAASAGAPLKACLWAPAWKGDLYGREREERATDQNCVVLHMPRSQHVPEERASQHRRTPKTQWRHWHNLVCALCRLRQACP